jgi:hypothetical protein
MSTTRADIVVCLEASSGVVFRLDITTNSIFVDKLTVIQLINILYVYCGN